MANFDIASCQAIVRAFEKGCAYSTDQRSVYAMATPALDVTKTMKELVGRFTDTAKGTLLKEVDSEIEEELQKAQESAGDIDKAGANSTDIGPNPDYSASEMNAQKYSLLHECIPCDFRQMVDDIANFDWSAGFSDLGFDIKNALDDWINQMIKRFKDIIDMFKNLGSMIDACAFIEWLTSFVCIPDLAMIMAALTALLMDISLFIDGFGFDLILSFLVPLVLPMLQGFVDMLMQFFMLIIKPLECIIDSLFELMDKLDFTNFRLPEKFKFRLPQPVQNFKRFVQDEKGDPLSKEEREKILKANFRKKEYEFYDANDIRTFSADKVFRNADGEEEIDLTLNTSFRIFDGLRDRNGQRVDPAFTYETGPLPDAQKFFDEDLPAIVDPRKYKELLKSVKTTLRSFFADIVFFLKQVIFQFTKLLNDLVAEFMALLQEMVFGFSASIGKGQLQKLAILRIIGIVGSIIGALSNPDCGEEDAVAIQAAQALQIPHSTVARNEDGNIVLEENDLAVEDANAILDQNDAILSGAKDPVITGIVEKIRTPVKVVFECNKSMTQNSVDQINAWISDSRG